MNTTQRFERMSLTAAEGKVTHMNNSWISVLFRILKRRKKEKRHTSPAEIINKSTGYPWNSARS